MTEGTTQTQLKAFIERIERLEEDKKGVMEDIKEIYHEAAANGFDVKAMRVVIRNRRKSKYEREELDALVETYEAAIET